MLQHALWISNIKIISFRVHETQTIQRDRYLIRETKLERDRCLETILQHNYSNRTNKTKNDRQQKRHIAKISLETGI